MGLHCAFDLLSPPCMRSILLKWLERELERSCSGRMASTAGAGSRDSVEGPADAAEQALTEWRVSEES